ncbi:GAF domain-containing protein [Candidatus Riflebacteria bacterium]
MAKSEEERRKKVENAGIIPTLNRRIRSTDAITLLRVSQKLASYESLDGMLGALVDFIVEEINAERATVFLHNPETKELYSRVARGVFQHEITISDSGGVAGRVFTTGTGMLVHDAYANEYFDSEIDKKTGFTTKNILCVPIRTVKGEIIGVAQVLNKKKDEFTTGDMALLNAIMTQSALALKTSNIVEDIRNKRAQEKKLIDVVAEITSEIDLGTILQKVMSQATIMLDCDRSTLFLNDKKTNELFSQVGGGLEAMQIRIPNHMGIAGTVFTKGETINLQHAYADLRFNPAVDKSTGYFTRNMLCVPVSKKDGEIIGVIQLLNKRRGPFNNEDEQRLRTFTGQVSVALENAKLFNDIQNMKNRNEGMLQSMSSGVITTDEDGKIITCNRAGLDIMKLDSEQDIINHQVDNFFKNANSWIMEKVKMVDETQTPEVTMDAEMEFGDENISVNLTVLPLLNVELKKLGTMIMIEDISSEKRLKSTMSRYMDPAVADQLLAGGEDILGGKSTNATVLFSDIRDFTAMTEEIGAQGTVSLLNEYFTIMVDCIQKQGGMLDKFIGDAIMAAFGIPFPHDDDEDRGVRAAISMLSDLMTWNSERISQGKKFVNMGIGLNTGAIVSGNIGSPKRMDYTMIGDAVNLASRLESACKQYSTRILISEFTFKKLKGTYRTREVDQVVVKGKSEPVTIYEVLDYHTEETFPNMMEVINLFKLGLTHYRKGKWNDAIRAFEEAQILNKDDKLCAMYLKRCAYLKANPPEHEWDGIWVMTSK